MNLQQLQSMQLALDSIITKCQKLSEEVDAAICKELLEPQEDDFMLKSTEDSF